MNNIFLSILLLLPINLYAQSQQDLMAQMQKMASCMQTVDQGEMKALENKVKQFSASIRTLCNQGKSEEAQSKAIDFSLKMVDSPMIKTVQKCIGLMPDSMKSMMPQMDFDNITRDYSGKKVCDEI